MKKLLNTKTVLGALAIGILSSALWETVFKNLLNFIFKILLTVSTLGLEKYRNDIYIDISKGFYEQVSIQILSLGIGVLFGFIIGPLLIVFKTKGKSEDIKESKIREWLNQHKSFVKTGFLLYTIFVITITILSITKITYVNKSIAYYKQLISIAAPYIELKEEEIFNSRFAQIKNKEDYINLTNELSVLINTSNQKLPELPSFIF